MADNKPISKDYLLTQLKNFETNIIDKKYSKMVELTQAEYDTIENKDSDNIVYFITDAERTNSGSVNTDAETLGGYSAGDFAKTTDLVNYLPLSGGDIKGEGTTPLGIGGDNYVACYLDFKRPDSLILGALGFYGDKPVFVPSDYSATRELLHAGNIADYVGSNVDKTSFTSFTTSTISGTLTYQVKNGVAFVTVCPIKNSEIASDIEVCELPTSNIEVNLPLISNTGGEYVGMFWMNADSGKLMARFFKASANGYATFSYPVKEN